MIRYALALLLIASPALSKEADGLTPLFVQHADGTKDIMLTKLHNLKPGDTWAFWEPVNDDGVAQHYKLDRGGLKHQPPPPPQPTKADIDRKAAAEALEAALNTNDDAAILAALKAALKTGAVDVRK